MIREFPQSPERPSPEIYNILVFDNLFLIPEVCDMFVAIRDQPVRKIQTDITEGEHFPDPFDRPAQRLRDTFRDPGINCLITKRYEPDEPSGAYNLHMDPKDWNGSLYIVTVYGTAELTTFNLPAAALNEFYAGVSVPCFTNTTVVLIRSLVQSYHEDVFDNFHAVSPPIPEGSSRYIAVFGHRCPKILSGEVVLGYVDDW